MERRDAGGLQLSTDSNSTHSILAACWHMLQTGELYNDPGGDYFHRRNPDRAARRLVRQLEALGHHVTL